MRRTYVGRMVRLGLVLVLLLAVACEAGSGGSADDGAPASTDGSRVVRREGVSIRLPAGWQETDTTPSPVTDPVVRLALSSGPIRPGGGACQVSAYDFPSDAVAIVLVEWRSAAVGPQHGPVRPERFTARSLPLRPPPAIDCFEGAGGSAQFVEAGRAFGAYVLLGSEAPAALAARARAVLGTLRVELELPRPVDLVELARPHLDECRRSALIQPACPTRVPRVREAYRSHVSRDALRPSGVLDVFDLERAPDRDQPDHSRPPRFAHIGLLAGQTERVAVWTRSWDGPAFVLRDGLMRRARTEPISFGRVRWGDTRGLLFLAPPFPAGGYLGDHLTFVWTAGTTSWAVSLHAWEPLREAVATLRAMTLSAEPAAAGATLDARSDSDGVLFVDGSGWTCGEPVLVDLPRPWAATNAEVARGELHLTYPVPAFAPYRGTVRASQRCDDGSTLSAETEIVVGDARAG